MKKLAQVLAAIVVSVGIVGSVAGVSTVAAAECTRIVISNTGQGSNNQGVCTVVRNVTATCINNTYILNQNDQQAVTGDASTLGNTTSGTTITGNATNTNGSNVQIGSSCGQTTTTTTATPTTPTPPATPTSTPAETKKVAALPYTASNSVGEIALISALVAVAAIAAVRVGTIIYRRVTLK